MSVVYEVILEVEGKPLGKYGEHEFHTKPERGDWVELEGNPDNLYEVIGYIHTGISLIPARKRSEPLRAKNYPPTMFVKEVEPLEPWTHDPYEKHSDEE